MNLYKHMQMPLGARRKQEPCTPQKRDYMLVAPLGLIRAGRVKRLSNKHETEQKFTIYILQPAQQREPQPLRFHRLTRRRLLAYSRFDHGKYFLKKTQAAFGTAKNPGKNKYNNNFESNPSKTCLVPTSYLFMSTHAEASLEKLARLLNQVGGNDPSTVLPSSRLKEDLDLESLEMMELLFKAEDEFGIKIEIPTESLADIKTVEDLLDLLLAKQ